MAGQYSRAILARYGRDSVHYQLIDTSRKTIEQLLDKYTLLCYVPDMGRTLGIHWAATTYGTWLHGDPRGSWRNGRLMGPDPYLVLEQRALMVADAVRLDATERDIIAAEFGRTVREQGHRIFAATIQAVHIHLVFAPLRESLDLVIARLKRRSAAAVLAQRRRLAGSLHPARPAETAGLYSRGVSPRSAPRSAPQSRSVPRSLWTAKKYPVFIFDQRHLFNAIEYVRNHNRRIGLPADPFDWIDPLFSAGEGS